MLQIVDVMIDHEKRVEVVVEGDLFMVAWNQFIVTATGDVFSVSAAGKAFSFGNNGRPVLTVTNQEVRWCASAPGQQYEFGGTPVSAAVRMLHKMGYC